MERSEIPMQTMWAEPPLKEVPMDTQQEFQKFYQDNLGLIYRYVYSNVGNRQEAEDLTSQIFLKVVRSLDLKRDPRSMRTWLFQVARTTIADYWRPFSRGTTGSLDALLEAGWA